MRRYVEGAGKGAYLTRRALCDDCTPNQAWILLGPLLGAIIVGGIFCYWHFAVYKPERDAWWQQQQSAPAQPPKAKVQKMSVNIRAAADAFSPEELAATRKVEAILDAARIGERQVGYGGVGFLHLEYEVKVKDADHARDVIKRAMAEHFPTAKYTVDVSQ